MMQAAIEVKVKALPAVVSVDSPCDETLQLVKTSLLRAGLRVLETFDLHDARLGLSDCPCPHHGLEACDCQMVVLMVYGEATEPVALTLHGNDGQTWLSMISRPGEAGTVRLQQAVEAALQALWGPEGL